MKIDYTKIGLCRMRQIVWVDCGVVENRCTEKELAQYGITVLGSEELEHLLENQILIPETWKKEPSIIFWGTMFLEKGGVYDYRRVYAMWFVAGQWHKWLMYVDSTLCGDMPAAILEN